MKVRIVHVESSAKRLRVIAKMVDGDSLSPLPLQPEVLGAGIAGLEQRIQLLTEEVKRLKGES